MCKQTDILDRLGGLPTQPCSGSNDPDVPDFIRWCEGEYGSGDYQPQQCDELSESDKRRFGRWWPKER